MRANNNIVTEYFVDNMYRIVNKSNKKFSKYHVQVSYIKP